MNNEISRREFVKKSAITTAGLAVGLSAVSAKNYSNIMGANDRINFAVVGVNGRGGAHIEAIGKVPNAQVTHLCEVDSNVLAKRLKLVTEKNGNTAQGVKDFRKLIEIKDIDAITIATPEHWHAPMTIMGVQQDKHVYVEKPCSFNMEESDMLLKVQEKTGKLIQMGSQQRSAQTSINVINRIREGLIGRPYMGKAWYTNTRGGIGNGKKVPVPANLDWELWQGPAPREDYRDNIVHYNWHWFLNWGTGEIQNNSIHEVDICRWALDVDTPNRVSADGGKYMYRDDDWEFYDTIVTNYQFEDDKMITWEGKSRNNVPTMNKDRGALIMGETGSVMMTRNGAWVYDEKGNQVEENLEKEKSATTDTVGIGGLDGQHMGNFVDAIRNGARLNSPIDVAVKSVNLGHYGNMAWQVGRSLDVDTKTGEIKNDSEAMKLWSRTYEKGWEPRI